MFSDSRFRLQKSTKPQKKHFGVQETCTELCGTVDVWITVTFPTFYLETQSVNILQKKREEGNIPGKLLDKVVESLDDHGCPKNQDFVDEEMCICPIHAFRLKNTLHFAERKAKLFGNSILHYSKL